MIRWEKDEENNIWYGYVGKEKLGDILQVDIDEYSLNFLFDELNYTKLSSAKRGAERKFKQFLKDTGLWIRKREDNRGD